MFRLLFHSDVFIPKGVKESCLNLQKQLNSYYFSKHFEEHLQNQLIEDRSHTYLKDVVIKCLDTLKTNPRPVFEVELSKDYYKFQVRGYIITKYCCRIPYSATQDIVVSIRPEYAGNMVVNNLIVTAWMNSNTDHHYTLDDSKYCSEAKWKNSCHDTIREVK